MQVKKIIMNTLIRRKFQAINDPKKPWNYFNFSLIGGIPLFAANSLKDVESGQM